MGAGLEGRGEGALAVEAFVEGVDLALLQGLGRVLGGKPEGVEVPRVGAPGAEEVLPLGLFQEDGRGAQDEAQNPVPAPGGKLPRAEDPRLFQGPHHPPEKPLGLLPGEA